MPGSITGQLFRVVNFGESHGPAIGVVVDGCPAGVPFDHALMRLDLERRRPGQNKFSSTRQEKDEFELLSGVFEGKTTGTPIALLIRNRDAKSKDYEKIRDIYRPSHADYTYDKKYGIRDKHGGGRSSARLTANTVMAGAIAKMLLRAVSSVKITAYVHAIGTIALPTDKPNLSCYPQNDVLNCPMPEYSKKMQALIDKKRKEGDSLGGQIKCLVSGMPPGLGEPLYYKLDGALASSLLSINAVKAVEIGSGVQSATMTGSEHNDPFYFDTEKQRVRTTSNNSGGIQGGISNGEDIVLTVSFKPVASIRQKQSTVASDGSEASIDIGGRHDPCVVPRAVPIVEAHVATVLADMWLLNQTSKM